MKKNILFVCSSNVCRSPYAEFAFKKMLEEDERFKGHEINVMSAAVLNRRTAIHGKTRRCLLNEGVPAADIDNFRPTHIEDRVKDFVPDVIIGMNKAQGKCIKDPEIKKLYVPMALLVGDKYKGVPDPFMIILQKNYDKVMGSIKVYLRKYIEILAKEL